MPNSVEIANAVLAGGATLLKVLKAAFSARTFPVSSVFFNVKSANSKFAKAALYHVGNVKKISAQNAEVNVLFARIHFVWPVLKNLININADFARRHSVLAAPKISENANNKKIILGCNVHPILLNIYFYKLLFFLL